MRFRSSRIIAASLSLLPLVGCYTGGSDFADQLNPYADSSGTELGQRNTSALGGGSGGGGGKQAESARHALEVIGAYRRAQAPQPVYPVVRPAEIRLMWIPDHLNRLGDLVPAHYYYLRVLPESFEVQDAFDNERLLNATKPIGYAGGGGVSPAAAGGAPAAAPATPDVGGEGGATPWQYKSK